MFNVCTCICGSHRHSCRYSYIHEQQSYTHMYTEIMRLIMQPPILFLHECTYTVHSHLSNFTDPDHKYFTGQDCLQNSSSQCQPLINNFTRHLHNLFRVNDTLWMLRDFPLQKNPAFVVSQSLATSLALYRVEKFCSAVLPSLVLYKH